MKQLNHLFIKYIADQCTAEEINFLLGDFKDAENEIILKKLIEQALESTNTLGEESTPDLDQKLMNIYDKIQWQLQEESRVKRPRSIKSWNVIMAVAALILVFSFIGFYLFKTNDTAAQINAKHSIKKSVLENDIAPGVNKAVLELADGTKIELDQAKVGLLANQGQTGITKTNDGQLVYENTGTAKTVKDPDYNTISIPRGGQYHLVLPDGTKVWLNAASSLTYPISFSGKVREVELTGEAYFEVATNEEMPFKVNSVHQSIEVLGTHFNVNAYSDEAAIKTTLLEGSIRVSHNLNHNAVVLKPGQQARLKDQIRVLTVDTEQVIAWKNGLISFESADIKSIMRQISRWYDVDVTYAGNLRNRSFTGKISRTSNLSEILNVLKRSHIDFEIEGKNITVIP